MCLSSLHPAIHFANKNVAKTAQNVIDDKAELLV
jgi:hypothetical protein